MKNPHELIRGYTQDLVVVHKHILRVIEDQPTDASIQQVPGAAALLTEVAHALQTRISLYETQVQERGGAGAVGQAEEAATWVTSFMGTVYGKVRRHPAARILRDDYTALCMLGVCEEMLHTTALSLGDERLAGFIAERMGDLPRLIMRVHDKIPTAVISDLGEDHPVDGTAAAATVEAAHQAWRGASVA